MKPKMWFKKDKEIVYRSSVADANWNAIDTIVGETGKEYFSWPDDYNYDASGTYLVNTYEGVRLLYEHTPVKKSKIEAMLCPYCLTMNIVNYDKLPAVSKLSCGACGGNLE